MSHTPVLSALLRRASVVRMARHQDAQLTTSSLLELSASYDRYQDAVAELAAPLQRLSRRHSACVVAVAAGIDVDVRARLDGRQLALLTKVLPSSLTASSCTSSSPSIGESWSHVATLLVAGARAGVWSAHDLHAIASQFLRRGSALTPEEATRAVQMAVYGYLGAHSAKASDAETLAVLTTMAVHLQLSGGGLGPDMSLASVQQLLAQRAVTVHAAAPIRAGLLGHLCAQWNRVQLQHTGLAAVVSSQAVYLAEEADLFAVVQSFLFLWRHPQTDEAALPTLLERLSSESLDAQTWSDLSRAVADPSWLSLRAADLGAAELSDTVSFLSRQFTELLAVAMDDGGLDGCAGEHLQTVANRLLALRRVLALTTPRPARTAEADTEVDKAASLPSPGPLPEAFVEAVAACAVRVSAAAEDLVAGESPPFALMTNLAGTPCEAAQACCVALLREAALQYVHLPTAQSFQFLLVVADRARPQDDDGVLLAYLSDAFVKTAATVPPLQLVTALRALARCEPTDAAPSTARARQASAAVSRFCMEKVRASLADNTMPVHALLVAVAALQAMGCREDAFYVACATYIQAKAALVSPTQLCRQAAAATSDALGEDLLDAHAAAHEVLLEAAALGIADDWALLPSAWMQRHDPANTLLPLTPAQRHCRELVEAMASTPAHAHDALVGLAQQYVAHLDDAHPDDLRRFFAVFEDKVLKEDAVLLTCVRRLTANPLLLARLSDTSLAAMLHSLAAVHFVYTRAVKEMLLGISKEQWESMSASALVSVVEGMAKLSLAAPDTQRVIGDRLCVLAPLLTPVQTALAIRAFQSLAGGSAEDRRAALDVLLAHAAKNARRFDEMSLSVLFSTPSVHRLLRTPAVALPLIHQAALQLSSAPQRQRIAASVRRSGLPRDLVARTTTQLLSPHAPPALQLAH